MNPAILLNTIIRPSLALLGPQFQGNAPERLLVAICGQETSFSARVQKGGPARGLWQFERGGGVRGVLQHHTTKAHADRVCDTLLYSTDDATVYEALADNDILACCFARLLLWSDPGPLAITQEEGWALYLRTWRPGKPHPERWPTNWKAALEAAL